MLAPYRRVLARPGARAFTSAALVGRLWLSMLPLGIVLLVSAQTHHYGLAGAVTAAGMVVGSVTASPFGRLFDRYGQRVVLLPAIALHAIGVTALVVAALERAAAFWLFVAAIPACVAAPPTGSLVRARWAALLGTGSDLEAAYALESVLDEVVFMAGPVVSTALATAIHPSAGVLAALAFTVAGTLALAAQRRTEPPPGQHHTTTRALAVPGIRVLVGTYLCTGILFGSFDVSMVAFATGHGDRAAAGWLLALIAAGSCTGGLLYGARRWQAPVPRRFVVAMAILATCALSLVVAPSLAVMAGAALLTGLAIAPGLIASAVLVEQLTPAGGLTEGLAVLSGAIGVGFSVGAPLAGHLVDIAGPHEAFAVGVAAAGCATVTAVLGQRWLGGEAAG